MRFGEAVQVLKEKSPFSTMRSLQLKELEARKDTDSNTQLNGEGDINILDREGSPELFRFDDGAPGDDKKPLLAESPVGDDPLDFSAEADADDKRRARQRARARRTQTAQGAPLCTRSRRVLSITTPDDLEEMGFLELGGRSIDEVSEVF